MSVVHKNSASQNEDSACPSPGRHPASSMQDMRRSACYDHGKRYRQELVRSSGALPVLIATQSRVVELALGHRHRLLEILYDGLISIFGSHGFVVYFILARRGSLTGNSEGGDLLNSIFNSLQAIFHDQPIACQIKQQRWSTSYISPPTADILL